MDYIIFILLLYLTLKVLLDSMQLHTVKTAQIDNDIIEMLNLRKEEINQSRNYNQDKLKLSIFRNILNVSLIYLLFYGDIFNLISIFVSQNLDVVFLIHLTTVLVTYLFFTICMIPVAYYSTFIIEDKYNFNNSTRLLFIRDTIISTIIGLTIVSILSAIFFVIIDYTDIWWLIMSLAIIVFIIISMYIYPTYISPIFNKFNTLNDQAIIDEIENLSNSTKFDIKNLYVMDMSKRSKHPNAYFTGFKNNRRIVFYDTLLKLLDPREIKAVLAHEIGHYKLKHISKSLILTIITIFLGMFFLSEIIDNEQFLTMLNLPISPSSKLIALVFSYQIISFFINPIFSILSRKNEYEADTYASEKVDSGYLISSLIKLYKSNLTFLIPNKIYALIYYSHPTVIERINNLRGRYG